MRRNIIAFTVIVFTIVGNAHLLLSVLAHNAPLYVQLSLSCLQRKGRRTGFTLAGGRLVTYNLFDQLKTMKRSYLGQGEEDNYISEKEGTYV